MAETVTVTSISLENRHASATTGSRNLRGSGDDPAATDINAATRLADGEAPEGGYGWVIIAVTAVINFWSTGTSYSWGILQAALLKQNVGVSASTISFVGSIWVASVSFFAIANARLIRLMGVRYASILGITTISLGEVLSGFSTHVVGGLFVTTGVVMGFGTSLCFLINSILPAQYFVKKRGIVNGIVYGAAGLGGGVVTIVMNALVSHLGPAWAYRIIGLITFSTAAPMAWLLKERVPVRRSNFVEWTLFRDVRFILIFIAGALATFPLMVAPFFLPLYSNSVGLSPTFGAGLVAAFNFSSAIGRVGFGYLCDLVGPLNSLFISQLLGAISMLTIWPMADSFAPLILFSIVNGMANGGFFSCMPTVVGNVFGSARVSVAMGMIVTSWAGGYLMGAPIAGYLLDAYGGPNSTLEAYHPAIFYAGSLSVGAAGIALLARFKLNPRLWAKV